MDAVFGRAIVAVFHPRSSRVSENVGLRTAQATGSHGKGVLQEEPLAAAAPTGSTRSIFTGPLKFLWFAKQKDSETIELSDVTFQAKENEAEVGSSSSSSSVDLLEDGAGDKRSWVYTIWGLKSMIERAPERQVSSGIPQERQEAETEIPVVQETEAAADKCLECGVDDADGCSVEVPRVQATHNKESFSRFLHPLPLPELKLLTRLTHLCILAYAIADIKPGELLKNFHLRFVTSSLDKKAEVLAKEQAAGTAEGQRTDTSTRFSITPGAAYALASAVASYLHSHTKALLQLKGQSDAAEDSKELSDSVTGDDKSTESSGDTYDSSKMASMIASSPMTAVVAAKEGTRDAVAKDLQSLHSCPCEWYCCDDPRNTVRYFVIQGSESLASWQANLLFEPTALEDSSLGVFVHRGIYEAAKGLYEQLLPHVLEHLEEHGDSGRLCFTGHSLGGSLATLVSLMLQIRGVVQRNAMLPVFTFGSPCIMCGGDFLLEKLGLPRDHIRSVILHRDIVPRTFACDYPDPVAEVLKRINGSFREHPCLNSQKLLYAPMGEFLILQPSEDDAPLHPLLPSKQGLYAMRSPLQGTDEGDQRQRQIELRAAQRAFLNSPHPLEILSDRSAYGSEGTISRDHDPRNYLKAFTKVTREEAKKQRRLTREQRRSLWWPVMVAELTSVLGSGAPARGATLQQQLLQEEHGEITRTNQHQQESGGFQHTQLLMLFFLSAKMLLTHGFAAFVAWS